MEKTMKAIQRIAYASAISAVLSLIAAVDGTMTLISPAEAGELKNIKISDITDNDLSNYCKGKLPQTVSEVIFTRGTRSVGCQATVHETASDSAAASAQAQASAERAGFRGDLAVQANGNSTFTATISSRQDSYRLTDYCREVVDRSWFNPFTGEGRVFVADGGYSCHKTIRE
jgi:hypothetical protein